MKSIRLTDSTAYLSAMYLTLLSCMVTYIHLDPSETLLLSYFSLRQNITRSITTNPAVHVTLFSALSSEQLPDWHTENLAFDIPEGQRGTTLREGGMLTKGRYRYQTWRT